LGRVEHVGENNVAVFVEILHRLVSRFGEIESLRFSKDNIRGSHDVVVDKCGWLAEVGVGRRVMVVMGVQGRNGVSMRTSVGGRREAF